MEFVRNGCSSLAHPLAQQEHKNQALSTMLENPFEEGGYLLSRHHCYAVLGGHNSLVNVNASFVKEQDDPHRGRVGEVGEVGCWNMRGLLAER